MRKELPGGTVTLLFTDIEGSTRLWEKCPNEMRAALARHNELVQDSIAAAEGVAFKNVGDGYCASFETASQALTAAIDAMLRVNTEPWVAPARIKVRMAIHTGAVETVGNDYVGPPLNRVARLLGTGHGGQILLSQATFELVRDSLPPDLALIELGEHRLRDLGRPERVYQVAVPGIETDFPPLRSLDNPGLLHNLPQQVTSFVGREADLATTRALLSKTRLLTLTGAGGSGKTRLALQLAADRLDDYPDGIWLVELAPVTDPRQVPQLVASVVGVPEAPGVQITQSLAENLRGKKLLLVLDNCEHLLDACAKLVDSLLRQGRDVKVLASSREPLGITGEQAYRVPSLSLPDSAAPQTPASLTQYEAVQLFIERAVLAQSTFQVTNENAPAVAALCCRLDGIPLAIELAAARVRSLSVEEINAKLDRRFRLLTGGSRAALPRQQTLAALVGWSYDLLSQNEQDVFEQLSVFVGGWTVEMAEQTCGDPVEDHEIVDLLSALVDKSLVNFDSGSDPRYSFYETIREYARDRLAARPDREAAALDRHAKAMVELGSRLAQRLRTPEEPDALRHLLKNAPNLTAALDRSNGQKNCEQAAGLSLALGLLHQRGAYPQEGVAFVDGALESCRGTAIDRELWGRLLCERATLGLDIFNERATMGLAILSERTTLALDLMEVDQAAAFAEDARAIAKELDATELMIRSEDVLGHAAMAKEDFATARIHFQAALRLSETSGNWIAMALLQNNLGLLEQRDPQGTNKLASEYYRAALGVQREQGYRRGEAESLNSLGVLAHSEGQISEAAALYLEASEIASALELPLGLAKTLSNFGEAQMELQNDLGAAKPLGIAEQLLCKLRSPYHGYTLELLQTVAKRLGWSESQLEQFRSECGKVEIKDAISASRQAG